MLLFLLFFLYSHVQFTWVGELGREGGGERDRELCI